MSIKAESTKAQNETVENKDNPENIDHSQTPRCEYHPHKEAESECDQCGKRICGLDMKHSGTIEICNECFLEDAQDEEFGNALVWPMFALPIAIVIAVFVWLNI